MEEGWGGQMDTWGKKEEKKCAAKEKRRTQGNWKRRKDKHNTLC